MTLTISASLVKNLRDHTGAGMLDCKKALTASDGDLIKATEWLRQRGISIADGKSGRPTTEGTVASYVHTGGKIAVLVEVNCETDFVARTDVFQELARNLAMQVAACPNVKFVSSEEIPDSLISKEKEIEMGRDDLSSKKEEVRAKIVEGRISKKLREFCLLDQPFVKDPSVTVEDLVKQVAGKVGENVRVKRFVRLVLGEMP